MILLTRLKTYNRTKKKEEKKRRRRRRRRREEVKSNKHIVYRTKDSKSTKIDIHT